MDAIVCPGGMRSSFVLRWNDLSSANIYRVFYLRKMYGQACTKSFVGCARLTSSCALLRCDRQTSDPMRQVDLAISEYRELVAVFQKRAFYFSTSRSLHGPFFRDEFRQNFLKRSAVIMLANACTWSNPPAKHKKQHASPSIEHCNFK